MIMSSLCFRVSLSVSHRWTEPLGVSEQHGSSRASVHQWQQHTAQRRSAAVHPRLQRPSSVRPAVREGEEKHDVIRRAEAGDVFRRWGVFSAHSGNKLRQVDFDAFEGHLVCKQVKCCYKNGMISIINEIS